MHVITSLSIKGGAGKTTLVQMLASTALEQGRRVRMLDGDADRQLLDWQIKSDGADWDGLTRSDWPDQLTISDVPPSVEALYAALDQWQSDGVDLVLIDTRPGEHVDTEHLALAADMVLVPAVPVQSDFIAAHRTLDWLRRMIDTLGPDDPAPLSYTVLLNADRTAMEYVTAPDLSARQHAARKVHAQDAEVFAALASLPLLATPIPGLTALRRLPITGPLGLVRDTYARDPHRRLQVGHLTTALNLCASLLEDIETVLSEHNG